MIRNFQELLEKVKGTEKTIAVICAHQESALLAAIEARRQKIANSILIGDSKKIAEMIDNLGEDSTKFEIIDEKETEKAVSIGISLVRDGEAHVILKGKVDTTTLMKGVLSKESGLRTGRLLSDVFIFEYPEKNSESKFILMSDGGVVLNPTLEQKIEIIKNAVEVAHKLGIENPKVAILSATELVIEELTSTTDAVKLKQLNAEGKITGCIIDGPLALDLAISEESAFEKGIKSDVAGKADILIVPNIESGNILGKSLTYFAHYKIGHVIIGAKAPVLIPSRSDKMEAKLNSIALGVLMVM
ncbi:phosphate butyryltransferase [Candidatus Kryptonium thompsonii]|uniref:Phosphate butyryltransferase n=3 Tax=Candidatus Kryptonium thompsonii TaxID=1633631 RepID=A0A0P1LNG0_9BACT|nr:bifunctional enoyl-CoA hydratase/phosphate acetyltransferase [Candidatus Kryptonium thompsoni]CUS82412.1 phosphate butyryltransferase [Candidatus Kryptonium thompsoni]CUS82778.1 phosphate butyryltransferase [Candidatus Kryptonium thompsoni]CUS83186.1 phosphate butyryltransferase [Candidatus Kryptonium thompsoni]CUS84295.1 phosphate butyryltransferase [Candidatus Kryptonium thompsoni]CUS88172.1 phosphate butyryltransferase [Candidatus Kryptonium thompsoni]